MCGKSIDSDPSLISLEPAELAAMVDGIHAAHAALGQIDYTPKASERSNLTNRRSLYAVADIKAGETLTETNIRSIRPGHGLAPNHLPELMGRMAREDIPRGTPLGWSLLDG